MERNTIGGHDKRERIAVKVASQESKAARTEKHNQVKTSHEYIDVPKAAQEE
jgi:hypothetical protein